jgi:hypothetical protein
MNNCNCVGSSANVMCSYCSLDEVNTWLKDQSYTSASNITISEAPAAVTQQVSDTFVNTLSILKVQMLYMQSQNITSIPDLTSLIDLQHLFIDGNPLNDGVLKLPSSIVHLGLSNAQLKTQPDLSKLKLTLFAFDSNGLLNLDLGLLPSNNQQLQNLCNTDTSITQKCCGALGAAADCCGDGSFTLTPSQYTAIKISTGKAPSIWLSCFTNVTTLTLSTISDAMLASLGKVWTTITTLDLSMK